MPDEQRRRHYIGVRYDDETKAAERDVLRHLPPGSTDSDAWRHAMSELAKRLRRRHRKTAKSV